MQKCFFAERRTVNAEVFICRTVNAEVFFCRTVNEEVSIRRTVKCLFGERCMQKCLFAERRTVNGERSVYSQNGVRRSVCSPNAER